MRSTGFVLHLLAAASALLVATARASAAESWEDLESRHAVLSGTDIIVNDVFDVARPADDTWLGHTANALHVRTRRGVVQRELLFRPGDGVDAARIHETERNLRRYPFIRAVHITPDVQPDATVRARVAVDDAWSLDAGFGLDHSGGATTWSVNVEDSNVAGAGKTFGVVHERNRERSANQVEYADPQLAGSRWTMFVRYADLSDGRSRFGRIERPFYAITTRYSIGGFVNRVDYTLTEYHLGDPVRNVASSARTGAVFAAGAFTVGTRTALRLGATLRSREYEYGPLSTLQAASVPVPDIARRALRGPSITWSVLQDRPATFENFASIGKTEDYNLGWALATDTGYYARRFGSSTAAPFTEAGVSKGFRFPGGGLVLMDGAAGGRHDASGWRGAVARSGLTFYGRWARQHTLAVRAEAVSAIRPDPEGWLYLDSAAGLRGYRDHFLAGDRRVVMSADDRVVTKTDIFGLVRMGFVLYADAGAIRRFDTGRWSRTYADVGAGLRLGSLKAARNDVIQISVACALVRDAHSPRVQAVLGNVIRF